MKTFVITIILVITCAWMIWAAWLTGPIISDSWQSVGAAAFSRWPLDMRGAFLGEFDGYDRTWGHHWPGWSMVLSMITSAFPFNSKLVFIISTLFILFTSISCYKIANISCSKIISTVIAAIVLLYPDINVSMSMMRPEPLASMLVIFLSWLFIECKNTNRNKILIILISAYLPMLHIIAGVAAFSLILSFVILNNFSLAKMRIDSKWNQFQNLLLGWIVGIGTVAFWFVGNTDRFHHIKQNMTAQKLSNHSLFRSFLECYFNQISGYCLFFLFLILIIVVGYAIYNKIKNDRLYYWGGIGILCVLFSFIVENPNRIHLSIIVPSAILAVFIFFNDGKFLKSKITYIFAIPILSIALAFHAKRIVKIISLNNIPDVRLSLHSFFILQQGDHRLYIPMSLWETAANLNSENTLFYTFPNVATSEYRSNFELSSFSRIQEGDRILFDVTQQKQNNHPYFKKESLVLLNSIDPYKVGYVIDTIKIRGISQKFEFDVIEIRNTK